MPKHDFIEKIKKPQKYINQYYACNIREPLHWSDVQSLVLEFIEAFYKKFGVYPEDEEVKFNFIDFRYAKIECQKTTENPKYQEELAAYNAYILAITQQEEARKLEAQQKKTEEMKFKEKQKIDNIMKVLSSSKSFTDKTNIIKKILR